MGWELLETRSLEIILFKTFFYFFFYETECLLAFTYVRGPHVLVLQDFLELKSQMVVGLLVDTGNQTWVLLRSAIVLSHASFFCFFCLFGFKIFIVRPCLTLQPG